MANIPTDTGKSDPEEHINTTATQSARDTDMLATGRVGSSHYNYNYNTMIKHDETGRRVHSDNAGAPFALTLDRQVNGH
jgi:hypothetical protein